MEKETETMMEDIGAFANDNARAGVTKRIELFHRCLEVGVDEAFK